MKMKMFKLIIRKNIKNCYESKEKKEVQIGNLI